MATAGEAADSSALSPSVPLRPMSSPAGLRPGSSLSGGRGVPRVQQSSGSSQSALSGRHSSSSGLRQTTSAVGGGAAGSLLRQIPLGVSLSSVSSSGKCTVAAAAAHGQRYAAAQGSDSASDEWCPGAAPSSSSRGSCSSSGATAGLADGPAGRSVEGGAGSGTTALTGGSTGSRIAGLAAGRAGSGAPACGTRKAEQARAWPGRVEAVRRGLAADEAAGPTGEAGLSST